MKQFKLWSCVLIAVVSIVGYLFAFAFINSIVKIVNSADYSDDIFVVTGAHFRNGNGAGGSRSMTHNWLQGNVSGNDELYIDSRISAALSLEDILRYFPIGSEINILYNKNLTRTVVQGETLRVLPRNYDFENDKLFVLAYASVIIFPMMLGISLLVYIRIRAVRKRSKIVSYD